MTGLKTGCSTHCHKRANLELFCRLQHTRIDGRIDGRAFIRRQQLNPRVVTDPVFRQRALLEHDRAIEDEALLRRLDPNGGGDT